MQQPIRKIVGRPPTPSRRLAHLEHLAALATNRVDFAVVGGLAVIFKARETGSARIPYLSPADLIFLKQESWREKDKLDVLALREILAREGVR